MFANRIHQLPLIWVSQWSNGSLAEERKDSWMDSASDQHYSNRCICCIDCVNASTHLALYALSSLDNHECQPGDLIFRLPLPVNMGNTSCSEV